MLSDELSPLAARLSIAAQSWVREDALGHRNPASEVGLLLDALNELNARRLRIAELEVSVTYWRGEAMRLGWMDEAKSDDE